MLRATVAGSAYVGVFTSALGETVLARRDLEEADADRFAEALDGRVVLTSIGGASTVGSLLKGNANGVIVSDQATDAECEQLTEVLDRPVERLPGPFNAAGNLIVANDHGALIHEEFSEVAAERIVETLGVPVERGSLGGVRTVGMAAVATNKGVLCHPNASEAELDTLEGHLGVPADVGTVNYGSPMVGSGLIANEVGYVVGERTTGPELGRIEQTLDLIE